MRPHTHKGFDLAEAQPRPPPSWRPDRSIIRCSSVDRSGRPQSYPSKFQCSVRISIGNWPRPPFAQASTGVTITYDPVALTVHSIDVSATVVRMISTPERP